MAQEAQRYQRSDIRPLISTGLLVLGLVQPRVVPCRDPSRRDNPHQLITLIRYGVNDLAGRMFLPLSILVPIDYHGPLRYFTTVMLSFPFRRDRPHL